MDVVIEGNCFVDGRLERCCIGIEAGRIVKIAKALDADRRHSFGSKLVLPAAIDSHVHFREPGMTHKEDFASGSLAALHGGVTCFLDMPNTNPRTTTPSALREKKALAASKSLADFGLFAGVQPGMDARALAKDAIGFKLYMAHSTGEMGVPSLDDIRTELGTISASGKVLAVHAEDESLRKKDIENGLEDHLRNRSNECEASGIRRIMEAARQCALHICHVSARESLPLLAGRRNLTSEVTPQHLLLDKDARLASRGKVNPPLRTRADRYAMMQHLKEGGFATIASDHSPHTLEEKSEDFDYAPSGMPGTETMVPLMLQLVREKHLTLPGLVSRLCTRPGETFGVRKGRIAAGYDADLMVVDLSAGGEIRADELHYKCGWTAFEGLPAIFPRVVFLRGEIMVEDGHLVGEGKGRDVLDSSE
jgi:dihydroorotase